MDTTNSIDRLADKVDELKAHPNFSVELDFIDPPKTDKELAKLLKKTALPQELLAFYALSDGIFITTETKGLPQKMAYAFELRSADLVGNPEVGLSDDLSDLDLPYGNFWVIDILNTPGNYVIAHEVDGLLELQLITFSKYYNKLNLSFADYLEKSIQYLGIDLWQQFYIDDPAKISDHYIYDPLYDYFMAQGIAGFPLDKIALAKKSCPLVATREKFDFKNRLGQKLKHLKEKGAVVQTEGAVAGASAGLLIKARETLGFQLSDFVLAFYQQIDGLEIDWSHPDGPTGQINLAPITVMLGGADGAFSQKWGGPDIHKKVIWTGEEDNLAFLKQNFLLEKYSGDSGFTSFCIDGQDKALVNYATGRSMINRTAMTLEAYLQTHLELMGCWHWLSIVGEGKEAKVGRNRVAAEINTVFPDFDTDSLLSDSISIP
ncbi:hypothetical protein [Flavobacterium sp.]|uniref:hypothetical protein n=1 Tax=Flavobacterium sp. TaxID=239 RepID=UPI0039E52C60